MESQRLIQEAKIKFKKRLVSNQNYTEEEVNEIKSLNTSLFGKTTRIDLELSKTFRSLAKLSQCELKPSTEIRSHRKIIGPVIVFLKKLSWPLIKAHLKNTLEGQQEFNSWTVYALAQQTKKKIAN